jgi:hypothetical protein
MRYTAYILSYIIIKLNMIHFVIKNASLDYSNDSIKPAGPKKGGLLF